MIPNPWVILGATVFFVLAVTGAHMRGVSVGEANITAEWNLAKLQDSEKSRATEKTWQRKLAVAMRELEQERQEHAAREADLRRDVDLGTRRLLIHVQRPERLSGDTGGPGGGDAEPVELARTARQAYHDLRAGIIRDTDTLKSCQAYVTAIGGWPPVGE
jgi:hypothetical protein